MVFLNLNEIDKSAIDQLVEDGVAEHLSIEYKQVLPGGTADDRKEFLADVTSLANASGGYLIYGLSDMRSENGRSTGIPDRALGLNIESADQEIQRLNNILRTGVEPRIVGHEFKAIEGFENGPVIALQVRRSWHGPHMVTLNNSSRFFVRTSNGKHQMDHNELKMAFAKTDQLSEQIKLRHLDITGRVLSNSAPVHLSRESSTILTLIPFDSIIGGKSLVEGRFPDFCRSLSPLGISGHDHRINIDGYLNYTIAQGGGSWGYTQVYRDGAIETVNARWIQDVGGQKQLPSLLMSTGIIEFIGAALEFYREMSLSPPVAVCMTLTNVKEFTMAIDGMRLFVSDNPIDRDILNLPNAIINDLNANPKMIAKPMLDALWQSCGYERCFDYNEAGEFTGGRR